MRLDVSCLAFSGFFLREPDWVAIAARVARFACVDALRDDPALDYARYLDEARRALLDLPPPYLILGHSFGAMPARSLARRLAGHDARLAMIAGLVPEDRQSATEAYAASGQAAMAEHCRLDLLHGRIELVDARPFAQQLFAPNTVPQDWTPARFEPLALVMESPPGGQVACPCHYVVCAHDAVAEEAAQLAFAARAGAALLRHGGGHLGPLRDARWLDAVCKGWAARVE
ncbi:alpha/beta fold hydrolase [Burkholderia plantarii]|uniref:AB hydrolase-1 domain-containing protein n=1 Tax=Burkholderia plantarii TaxID=41899 RepID=A0A0B6S4E5_BURPL|nr:alpha/beta fold hydrolase [Burkholderia plantarii]AJK48185.1 hypothetical protein BGL_2c00870 [Burkholderia plantarii]ALK32374.1 hypothetical protein bpln_2g00880 [Burkholderia plantarii]WLE61497.1 alpha/beta fold hydrolase [Burkholderia plantarii]GLZ18916.1 hypothetical protein Bpla01_24460 [Burkholderia plantarii]